jgi:predicted dehydrogenase
MGMSIGVGILGFAHGHVGAYCAEWKMNAALGVRLVAGWDHDSGRLAKSAEAFRVQECASPGELLSRDDVQAVVIGAETSRHADMVEAAAAAGKVIALQKPLALTMGEADRIVAAVERARVPFTVAWQMRVDPQNLEIRELIRRGTLGRVFMVRRRHGLPTQLWDIPGTWHFKPELNRDIWADDSAHPIDFVHWLLGVPETVTAEIASLLNPAAPNDNGIAIFRYADGTLAEVACSFTSVAAENTVEVIGEKGSIVQNYGDVPSCNVPRPAGACGQKWYTLDRKDWTCSDHASPGSHGARITGLAGPLAEFFRGARPPIATAEEGRTSLRMVLATYISSREGRRVRIDDPSVDQV